MSWHWRARSAWCAAEALEDVELGTVFEAQSPIRQTKFLKFGRRAGGRGGGVLWCVAMVAIIRLGRRPARPHRREWPVCASRSRRASKGRFLSSGRPAEVTRYRPWRRSIPKRRALGAPAIATDPRRFELAERSSSTRLERLGPTFNAVVARVRESALARQRRAGPRSFARERTGARFQD